MEHRLTAMDRCDRCRAPALAKTLHEDGPITWCLHHFEKARIKDGVDVLTPCLVVLNRISPDVPEKEAAHS